MEGRDSSRHVPSTFFRFLTGSVRGRLFLLVAALVLPTLGIVVVLMVEAYSGQREAVTRELSNTARAVASLVDAEVDRSSAMLETLAATRSLRDQDWESLDAVARRLLADPRRWLVVMRMDGEPVIHTRLPYGSPLPSISPDPAFVDAMQAGRRFVSQMVVGAAAKTWVIYVGIPYRHPNGDLYALSLVMQPDAIGESLNLARFAPGGVLAVVDRTGRIIARNPNHAEFSGKSAMPDIVEATRTREEGVGESVTLEGIPVTTAHARAHCGWSVAIGTPKSRVFASAKRLLFVGVGASLLVSACAIGLAARMAQAIVREVDRLTQDAERIGKGEPPSAERSDLAEINVVAQGLRRLALTKSEAEAELRVARDRLQHYAAELERKVEERTASLRDAVTQMEEFSYTVSHDLRSPLRAITGYAQVLLEDHSAELDATCRDYLGRIARAGERMDRLTRDVLNYSRVTRGEMARTTVCLETVIRNAVDHYSELHPRDADIVIMTPMHCVIAHEPSIVQVLSNLLTNAAKFVPPGERPHITLRTERRDTVVRVWVEDQGIGIPEQYQDKLFRIFERAPTEAHYEGTGVGLAIVRRIVERLGGQCGVESDGVSGSRFWIELQAA